MAKCKSYEGAVVCEGPTEKAPRMLSIEDWDWHWADAFVIIQGHQLMWWPFAQDFDNGEAPAGHILVAGHAGIWLDCHCWK